ncbi:MAG: hypothetical protein ACI4QX_10000, partial [Lachnospiraceae bacterium]
GDTGKTDTQATGDTGKTDTQAADDTGKTDTQSAPGENSVLPKAIEDAESIPFPDIIYSGWELSRGKEMAESIRKAILDINGGAFMLCFVDESTAVLGTAAGSFTGTYEAMDENNAIHIVFEEAEYYATFTEIDEEVVMILVNNAEPGLVLYMRMIDEG